MLQLLAILFMSSVVHAVDYKFVHRRCTDTCQDQVDGQYLDCGRCDRFVSCSGGQLYRMGCPASTAYDGYLGVCVHPTQPGCSLKTGARDPPLKPGQVVQQSRADPAPGEHPPSAAGSEGYRLDDGPSGTKEYPSGTKEYPSVTKEYPSVTKEYPSVTKEYPSVTKEYPSVTKEYPSVTKEYPSDGKEYPSGTKEYPSDGKEFPSVTKEYPSGTKEYPSGGTEYRPSTKTDQYAATVYSPTTETPDYPHPDGYITPEPPYVSTSKTTNDYQPPSNPQTIATVNQPTNPSNPPDDLPAHPLAYTAGSEPNPALPPSKTTTAKTPETKGEPGHDLNSYGLAYDPFNPAQHPSSRGCSNCKKSCADAPTANSIIVTCDECCYLDCATKVKVCP